MGCRPMRDWVRDKRCIHTIATFDGNLSVWRCLAIYKRHVRSEKTQAENFRAALDLACEYYGDNNLKRKDVMPTKLVDFEGIAKHRHMNIMLYETKKDSRKDARSI